MGARGASLQGWAGPGRGARARGLRGGSPDSTRRRVQSDSALGAGQVGARGSSLGLGGAARAGRGGGASAPRGGRWPERRAASRPLGAPGSAPGALRSGRGASAGAAGAAAPPPPPRRFLRLRRGRLPPPSRLSAQSGIEGVEGARRLRAYLKGQWPRGLREPREVLGTSIGVGGRQRVGLLGTSSCLCHTDRPSLFSSSWTLILSGARRCAECPTGQPQILALVELKWEAQDKQ